MRRPASIIRSLFNRPEKGHVAPTPAARHEHGLPAVITDARQEKARAAKLQMVHATKTHPGVKKVRNRAANKRARAARKRNRT